MSKKNIHLKNLKNLRNEMAKENIDWYLICHGDPHQSEYIGEHDKIVKWFCGFSGSNATVIVGKEEAFLWTDGRYFLQAKNQLKESGVSLIRMGVKGEPTVLDFLKKNVKTRETLAYDGRYICVLDDKKYTKILEKKRARILSDSDLIDRLWENRPKRIFNPIWEYDKKYSGIAYTEKIKKLRAMIKKSNCNGILVSDLTEIAWILNLRGSDISTVPVFYSYLYVDSKETKLFIEKDKLNQEISFSDIEILPYEDVFKELLLISDKSILIDPVKVSVAIKNSFSDTVKIKEKESPIESLKAIKNKVEIKNTVKAHILDGVALTKLIYELKFNDNLKTETEVMKRLYELRSALPGFVDESFTTIAAYEKNAAMMHYTAKKESEAKIMKKGFLLIDSGGHYLGGTTDVTRTIALGKLSDEQIKMYTLVLKSHLSLMDACFLKGTTGENLDILAREEFWKLGLDYRSGTGHGVGHLLSVHEGPHSIRHRYIKDRPPVALSPGMIVTDEPGYYEEGNFGIRIENELLVTKYKQTDYGDFYRFKPLTVVPYEPSAIDIRLLETKDKAIYNTYNKFVRKSLLPYLNEEERKWLKSVTEPIK